jgi:predicted urease superfamily metal-dependent hydrolase
MINIFMKQVSEGNVYNMETDYMGPNRSKVGIQDWSTEVRKQLMQHLSAKSPEEVEKIIKTTFVDVLDKPESL